MTTVNGSALFSNGSPEIFLAAHRKHGIKVPVHHIAHTTCLKIVPGNTNPLKPSHEPSFFGVLLLA
jgi:hypothetical protein